MADYLSRTCASLTSAGPDARWYSVDSGGPGHAGSVWWEGREVLRASSPERQVAALLWWIKDTAIDSLPDHVRVHASAVACEGQAILAIAESGGGKSTLAAGLVLAGCRYLSDEVAAIDPATGVVVPFPKPIHLEPGSWDALPSLDPRTDPELARFDEAQWRVDPRTIRPDAISPPVPVGSIIAVRYDPSTPTRLEPISAAEGLFVLAQNLHRPVDRGRDSLGLLSGLVEGRSCFRLTSRDLDEAVALVLEHTTSPARDRPLRP